MDILENAPAALVKAAAANPTLNATISDAKPRGRVSILQNDETLLEALRAIDAGNPIDKKTGQPAVSVFIIRQLTDGGFLEVTKVPNETGRGAPRHEYSLNARATKRMAALEKAEAKAKLKTAKANADEATKYVAKLKAALAKAEVAAGDLRKRYQDMTKN